MSWTNSERILCHAVGFNRNLCCCAVMHWLHCSNPRDFTEVGRIPTVYFFHYVNWIIHSKRKHWYKIAFQIWQSFDCCVSNMCERKGMLRNLHFKGHSATAPGFWKPQLEPAGIMVGLRIWFVVLFILNHFCQRCIPCGISTHVEIGKTCSKYFLMFWISCEVNSDSAGKQREEIMLK